MYISNKEYKEYLQLKEDKARLEESVLGEVTYLKGRVGYEKRIKNEICDKYRSYILKGIKMLREFKKTQGVAVNVTVDSKNYRDYEGIWRVRYNFILSSEYLSKGLLYRLHDVFNKMASSLVSENEGLKSSVSTLNNKINYIKSIKPNRFGYIKKKDICSFLK